ncbi:MAG: DNA polymerase III subunit chi [Chlamydiae bacterium]|nr:DNA polymerase III subunit chi [Chlamydiota bacterium]
MNRPSHVIFFQVKEIKTKILKIIQTTYRHFEKKEPLLIKVMDEPALKFVDELLWKTPIESFLPHVVSNTVCQDLIVITKEDKNLNQGALLNLSPDIVYIDSSFKTIYDFDDFTSHDKQLASKKRFNFYRERGCSIELQA